MRNSLLSNARKTSCKLFIFQKFPPKPETPKNPIMIEELSNSSENRVKREKFTRFANWSV